MEAVSVRAAFLIVFLAMPIAAAGPLNRHKDALTDIEFNNAYHDIANPAINVGTASTFTITSASATSLSAVDMTVTHSTFTDFNVTNWFAYNGISMVKIVQIKTQTTGTTTNTTSASYTDTSLTMSFTTKRSDSTVLIWASGALRSGTAGNTAYATLANGSFNMGPNNGFCQAIGDSSTGITSHCSILAFESPGSVTRTYKVQLKSDNGVNNVAFGVNSSSQTMVAVEYVP